MREYTTPGEVVLEAGDHLLQPLIAHAEQRPDIPLFSVRSGDEFVDMSAREVWQRVRQVAKGLIAWGLEPDERVALMSATRYEWLLLDYAILAAGATTVPIYETSSAEQIEWICSDSGAVMIFLENQERRQPYDRVADRLPGIRRAEVIEDGLVQRLTVAGEGVSDEALDKRIAGITMESLATIIYTSGTTGRPKGCLLTQRNLRSNCVNTLAKIGDILQPSDSKLLFLPLAHILTKMLALAGVETGARIGFATSLEKLTEELPMFRPTIVGSVPRVFEKVYAVARQKAQADGKGAIFDRAAEVAERYSRQSQNGRVTLGTRLQHAVFDRLVYVRLRAVFGGRLHSAVSGGGPLGERLAHFFNGIGIRLFEGYGLTETSPVTNINRPGEWRIGTVGRPIPGTTIAIADNGEVLMKGPQIFSGYHNDPEATRQVIDDDGWFHSGDLGDLDADGYLRITGRMKEIIVTAAGKNVAPAVLEDRIRRHSLVSQAMVVGDGRPFVGALITIDEDFLARWATEHGRDGATLAELSEDPDLRATVQEAVDDANEAVSRAESIREFRVLPKDFSIESGELTPTLKVKRRVVEERYGQLIDSIYAT